MTSLRHPLTVLLVWFLAISLAFTPAMAGASLKTASREKFFDTLEYRSEIALQLVEASEESCLYDYDLASGDSFYNYFRDYNPQTGRYQQNDYIGLWGGTNTFAYALNPLSWIDPFGLKRKKRNCHLAGGCHPSGVPFDKGGNPNFTDIAIADVNIGNFTGIRRKDERLANCAVGLNKTPEGHTWHHHQDQGRMQLMDREVHRATGHDGRHSMHRNKKRRR